MKVDLNTDTYLYCILNITPVEMTALAAACGIFARQLTETGELAGELPGNIDKMVKTLLDIEKGYLAQTVV